MNTENFTGKAEAYAKGRPGAAFDRDSEDGLLRCNRVTKIYSERIE